MTDTFYRYLLRRKMAPFWEFIGRKVGERCLETPTFLSPKSALSNTL